MKLADWIGQSNIARKVLASRIGVSKMAISRYERGERIPEKHTMAAIFAETRGEVAPNDFYSDVIAEGGA
jgi:transcriptional regulator with XRE-family HTH domain